MSIVHKTVLTMFLVTACQAWPDEGQKCFQEKGNREVAEGNYEVAFQILQQCETAKCVSATTLGQLAFLYADLGFGEFDSERDRFTHVLGLYQRAALLGSEDAIETLIDIYSHGGGIVDVRASSRKVECFKRVLKDAGIDPSKVQPCLGNE